ncbi:MAG TPA: hypothetical protein VF510_00100, partial [Ktedonobacterales bacterium]
EQVYQTRPGRSIEMPEALLVFAAVNLALGAGVALPPLVRHRWTSRQLVLAGVPVLWAMLMLGAYLYLWATIPPSPLVAGPDGIQDLRIWNEWEDRASTASFQAFCLTVATLLSVITMWLAYSIRARRRRARFA